MDARDPYALTDDPATCRRVLEEFGCDPERGHIINGHTPVHASAGERPVRAGGRLVVIDGGFCQAYHKTTGIAGYTLIADPRGMRIKAHRPFASIADVLDLNADIMSDDDRFEVEPRPLTVGDTDTGVDIRSQIAACARCSTPTAPSSSPSAPHGPKDLAAEPRAQGVAHRVMRRLPATSHSMRKRAHKRVHAQLGSRSHEAHHHLREEAADKQPYLKGRGRRFRPLPSGAQKASTNENDCCQRDCKKNARNPWQVSQGAEQEVRQPQQSEEQHEPCKRLHVTHAKLTTSTRTIADRATARGSA
nr:fructose-bisphosphatase class III [Olsenella profusa]